MYEYQGRICSIHVLMLQNHSILVHLVYIKPGGVPDKLCVFPADES